MLTLQLSDMIAFSLLALAGLAASVPARSGVEHEPCNQPVQRIEWRNLSSLEQQSYIHGVLCLKTKPSRLGLNTTLFDDFAYVHHNLNAQSKTVRSNNSLGSLLNIAVHFVAAFLPWHRYYLQIYENALQECGYVGAATSVS